MPICLPQRVCQSLWLSLYPNAVTLGLASILSNFDLLSRDAGRRRIWTGRLPQILIQAHFSYPLGSVEPMWRFCHTVTALLNAHVAILQQNRSIG